MDQNERDKNSDAAKGVSAPEILDAYGRRPYREVKQTAAPTRTQKFLQWRAGLSPATRDLVTVLTLIVGAVSMWAVIHYSGEPPIATELLMRQATIGVVAIATESALKERGIELRERANITYDVTGPDELAEGDNVITLYIHNIGRSDASKVAIIRSGVAITESGRALPTYSVANEDMIGVSALSPGETRRFESTHVKLDSADIRRINRRADYHAGDRPEEGAWRELSLYSTIRYWDGFRCRRLNICRSYKPKATCPEPCGPGVRVFCTCDRPIMEQEEDPKEKCGQRSPILAELEPAPSGK